MSSGPTALASMRDAWLVARFELLRAIRTWQALAIVVLYVVTTAGAARIFVNILEVFERSVAQALGAPATDYPGAMMDRLLENDELRELVAAMVGDAALVDSVLAWPLLAVFHLWIGIALTPFLAAATSAESISVDLRSRALRFELQRTGRLELVVGRFLGQALLTLAASLLSVTATFTIGMLYMVGNDPLVLIGALAAFSLRSWAFGLPFLGIGVACSQLTASPAWARVLAIVACAGTWMAYGAAHAFAEWSEDSAWGLVSDAALQVLPQGWVVGLWQPGAWWLTSATVFLALGLAATGAGYVRFARRDL